MCRIQVFGFKLYAVKNDTRTVKVRSSLELYHMVDFMNFNTVNVVTILAIIITYSIYSML